MLFLVFFSLFSLGKRNVFIPSRRKKKKKNAKKNAEERAERRLVGLAAERAVKGHHHRNMPLSLSLSSSLLLLSFFFFFSVFLFLNDGGRSKRRRRKKKKTTEKIKKRGRAPTGPPKCVAFAFGADVLFDENFAKTSRFRALLRDTMTFWAFLDEEDFVESMVLYFDGFGAEEELGSEKSSLMVTLEECFASLSSSSSCSKDDDGDEGDGLTRRREVRVKRYASSSSLMSKSSKGEMETIGEYVLCCCAGGFDEKKGEEEIAIGREGEYDEDVDVVANGGAAVLRRRRRRRSAASAASSPRERTTDPEEKKKKKNAPMDVIVLTSATGYDILSSFARSLKRKRGRAPLKTDEEKEAFLSSLVFSASSPTSSSSSSSTKSSPATVALIERELKTNYLKNQLPTPELLLVVSDIFSVGKFPGFLLSKCELAHAPPPPPPPVLQRKEEKKKKRTRGDDDSISIARHRKILEEYLRSFQRFGA